MELTDEITGITIKSPTFYRTEVWRKREDGSWFEHGATHISIPHDSMQKRIENDINKGYTVAVLVGMKK